METHQLFYIVGGIFIVIAVIFFAWDFIMDLTKEFKVAILFTVTALLFFIGLFLRGRGK
ncbi:MAG: hypothetical protein JSW73_03545 [Candidatus Woesearchaeota archaeon]|nr:MAG: hypothetical protein JSW73_03545 [Candidatus Woesearchaeota archaeon]